MHAPLYDIEGIAGWGMFGFTLAFVSPSSPPTLGQFLFFLLPLTVALATVFTFIAWLVGLHVLRAASPSVRRDTVRARREGYLVAFAMVAMMLLHSVGTLTITSVALLLVVVILSESLALTGGFRMAR
jgi:hypothetical protein